MVSISYYNGNRLSSENYQKSALPLFSNSLMFRGMAKTKQDITSEDLEIAENIKRLRMISGYKNQDDLAEAYGCSKGYIGRLEAAFVRPGKRTAKKLAKLFNCDPWDILIPPSQYKQADIKPHKDGEMVPGSYGTPPLPHQVVELNVPTKAEARKRLVEQLDRILDHPDQSLVRAITANLEAFSSVAEMASELRAMKKRIDELETKNKILEARLKKREGGGSAPAAAIGHDLIAARRTNGGPI